MAGMRRIGTGLVALAGIVLVCALAPGSAAARRPSICVGAVCLPSTPPSAGAVTLTGLLPTAAAFSAPYDGGSDDSQYAFELFSGDTLDTATAATEVAGGSPSTTATGTLAGLEPNAAYGVRLADVDDATGQTGYGPETTFSTPLEPAVPARLEATVRAITIGQSISLTASAASDPFGADGTLQVASAPFRAYRPYRNPNTGAPTDLAIGSGGSTPLTAEPLRNVRLRLDLPGESPAFPGHQVAAPSVSAGVSVVVFPTVGVRIARRRHSSRVQVAAAFETHAVAPHFRGEPVFFYRLTTPHGVGRLIGQSRLRATGSAGGVTYLYARTAFSDRGRVSVAACVRHAVLADMGVPFDNRACGRRTYRPRS